MSARFADELVSEFGVPRSGLIDALEVWGEAFGRAVLRGRGSAWSRIEAAKLDELDRMLGHSLALMWELEPQLARELAGVGTTDAPCCPETRSPRACHRG